MNPLRYVRRSVRGKLIAIVFLTTTLTLLVAGVSVLVHDLSVYRKTWAADVASEAAVLALSTAPALAFNDRDAAAKHLAALGTRPSITSALLQDARGAVFARFADSRAGQPPPSPAERIGISMPGEHLTIVQPVRFNGETLGQLVVSARYDLTSRVGAYLGIFSMIGALSLGVAFILSVLLQRWITVPLEDVARVAQRVVHAGDYTARVTRTTNDEIGLAVEALNRMLDEVQARTQALERSNATLRDQIAERERASAAQKRAEQERQETEKVYRGIGESIDFGVWIADEHGGWLYASDSFLRLTGRTLEQCANSGWLGVLHPDEVEITRADWQRCVQRGGNWYREYRVRRADGTYHPVLAQGVPIKHENGAIRGWAGINLDISRLKRTEQALRDADRRKDEFLATLAHELRNPLAPVRHATHVLGQPQLDTEQQRWARDVITRQIDHMAVLLDDLLDVSRITRGRMELRRERASLQEIVDNAVETARPIVDARNHDLRVDTSAASMVLFVDPLRLAQALSNLLVNAAKYTDPGGVIELTARREESGVRISVTDNGIGLTAESLSNIFEMFSQVDSALGRSEGGLGIGLALVKGLVELHDGRTEASSLGLGFGSTFTLHLPASCLIEANASAPAPGPAELAAAEDSPAIRSTAFRAQRILVADDNRDAAEALSMLLRFAGHEVVTVHAGLDVLPAMQRHDIDACILDIGMPDMNGYEVARRIRATPGCGEVLLIALTGWGQERDVQRAREAGFDRHFTKPVDGADLEAVLAEPRTSRSAERERAVSSPGAAAAAGHAPL